MANQKIALRTYSQLVSVSTEWIFDKDVLSIKKQPNAKQAIALMLGNMQNFLNIDNPMSVEQLAETAHLIISQYPHFKVPDIAVFCNGVKVGNYVKVFNRLNGQIIFQGLAVFDQERLTKIQDARKAEQQRRAGELDKSDCDGWVDMTAIYERAREEQREKMKEREQRQDKAAFAAERERQIEELKKKNTKILK